MSRKQKVLRHINRDGWGIEVGPSHEPIAPKREGFNVHIIDHATRAELMEKYRTHPVNIENIEEVDFVWTGQPYAELTGRPHFYDWMIASHVIEHTPDLIGFLADCDSLLKDDAVLCLVIPDKRRCFDCFRPITGIARVIDSHLAGNTIHSAGTAAEYFMNVISKGDRGCWNDGWSGDYRFYHSTEEALDGIRRIREEGAYLDLHNWCFVPQSFRLLIEDLHALGFCRLREVDFMPTEGCEFYVTLGRHGKGPGMTRLDMLQAIDAELNVDAVVQAPPARRWFSR